MRRATLMLACCLICCGHGQLDELLSITAKNISRQIRNLHYAADNFLGPRPAASLQYLIRRGSVEPTVNSAKTLAFILLGHKPSAALRAVYHRVPGSLRSSATHNLQRPVLLGKSRFGGNPPSMSATQNLNAPVDEPAVLDDSLVDLSMDEDTYEADDPDEQSRRRKQRRLAGWKRRAQKAKQRKVVNPLSNEYQRPLVFKSGWMGDAFANPNASVVLDIGCAKGTYCLNYAKLHPEVNVLGLEINRALVQEALSRKEQRGLNNVHFLPSNANVDLPNLLKCFTSAGIKLELVTIQFPDPCFKMKHRKRRLVTHELVRTLAKYLHESTRLFVQSDVPLCEQDMVDVIVNSTFFDSAEGYDLKRMVQNKPATELKSEREAATEARGEPVYRMLFRRNTVPVSHLIEDHQ